MKRLSLSVIALLVTAFSFAQRQNPVSWNYEAIKKSADTYEIVLTATVEEPWHIYSQNTGKGGPIPTAVVFKPNPLVTKNGKVKELGKLEKVFDKNFNTDVLYFSDKVKFVQLVKVKGGIKTNLSGTVEYMVCDESQCLPPVKKSFDLKLQ
ncbi:MAG TPA: protein-disulfide reductase DsbD domain-containing protein [Sediminibacterium sp.]|jgi:thiol:disulfide interchange protein DsbD